MKLSVVIPCYNEAENLPLLFEKCGAAVKTRDVEIIFVNNGSTDASAEILRRLLPDYPFARTVHVPINHGYGFGVLSGLKNSRGTYLGWTHADMQADPHDIIHAADIIDSEDKNPGIYIKGLRKGRRLTDNLFTVGMSLFESIYFRNQLWDINAQPNIFHRSFYEKWKNPPHDFSLDLYAYYMALKHNLRIIRFGVTFPDRIYGQSKWNTGFMSKYKFIGRTIAFSRKLKAGGIL